MITYVKVDNDENKNDEQKSDHQQPSELQIEEENKSKFNDFVYALDQTIHRLCHNMNELRDKMINRGNVMVSCYEPGAYYIAHQDNPNGNGRILTALLYLNPSWQKQDGGELLIHRCGSKTHAETLADTKIHNECCITIEPIWNRLVLFWSDKRNLHQVITSNRNRYAISIWYLDVKETLKAQHQNAT